MDETTNYVRTNAEQKFSPRKIYFAAFIAIAMIVAAGFLLVPDISNSGTVSGQDISESRSEGPATDAMVNYALNFRSAANYTVFGGKGIVDSGYSAVRGETGDGLSSDTGIQAGKELSGSIDALRQLPCTQVEGGMTGKSFEPGVYCVSSADLAGGITLDGRGNPGSVFIFKTDGSINLRSGSSIELTNEARAAGVFFVAGDSISVGDGVSVEASLIGGGDVTVGSGASVKGRTLSEGKVTLNENSIGGGTGTLQICKALAPSTVDISNRIFNFTVTGVAGTIAVPVGSCSAPIDVPVGPATITELNTGQTTTGGSFSGNFSLIGVDVITPNSTSTLGLVNLQLRTAAITVVEGGPTTQLTLRFTNQFAITGFVEICKSAATNAGINDPDATGFFNFTIEGVFTTNTQNPTNRVLQNFVAPVGQCTGPIAVTIFNPAPTGTPRESTVRVTELGRTGFFLESANTIPANREVGTESLGLGINAFGGTFTNPGGGFITVRVIEGATPSNETIVNFVNRSNPSLVKVCKIAGPGIPLNTIFRFTVSGTGPNAATPPQTTPNVAVTRTVDVRAGTPESGGTCAFVPGFGGGVGRAEFQTFVNGTVVTIVELGISPINDIPQPATGQVRASRVRSTSGFVSTAAAGFSPNPDLTPAMGRVARAAVPARASVVEVEFVNFRFSPSILKICKIGGTGVATDGSRSFTFDVALVSPTGAGGPLFPAASTTVTVLAGPASQSGFCNFVDGSSFIGGAFNAGSTVTITERTTTPGTTVTAITSPTTGVGGLTVDLTGRRGTLSGSGGLIASTIANTVVFTNAATTAPAERAVEFDFDGDRKADPSIFRPSTGTWWIAASGSNGQHRAANFGLADDQLVAADYDGDMRSDYAVFRNGVWHILGSSAGYRALQFGLASDIPQTGDFDGDGNADIVVFRPSNGVWYMQLSRDGFRATAFGTSGDVPVAADFDGDGSADPAVYRNGTWYMLRSRDGFGAVQFGIASDRPVGGDYDGDGRSDVAVYRNGVWHILRSGSGHTAHFFGMGADKPVPADYDGDGRTDIAVFRPSNGVWHMLRSGSTESTAYTSLQFGFGTDTPIPF